MRRKGEAALFEMKTVDLELNVIARAETNGNVKLFVVDGGAKAGIERAHKITVHIGVLHEPDTVGHTPPSGVKTNGKDIKKID